MTFFSLASGIKESKMISKSTGHHHRNLFYYYYYYEYLLSNRGHKHNIINVYNDNGSRYNVRCAPANTKYHDYSNNNNNNQTMLSNTFKTHCITNKWFASTTHTHTDHFNWIEYIFPPNDTPLVLAIQHTIHIETLYYVLAQYFDVKLIFPDGPSPSPSFLQSESKIARAVTMSIWLGMFSALCGKCACSTLFVCIINSLSIAMLMLNVSLDNNDDGYE